MDTLNALLEEQLQDLYNAENQLTKALPKMAKKASNAGLQAAFKSHLDETKGQIERLKEIGEELGIKKLTGKVCKAMKGLIEEGAEVLEEDGDDAVIDAALIAAAQRVEHYEIAAYGTVRAIADQLGHTKVSKLLSQTLKEESACDEKLTKLSVDKILPAAPQEEE